MTPTEQDKELREQVHELFGDSQVYDGGYQSCYDGKWTDMTDEVCAVAGFITADRKRVALEARIDTATDILYGFSRTYKQKVTDSAGNVYVNESHGYISRYEVQELVAKLKAQQEEV